MLIAQVRMASQNLHTESLFDTVRGARAAWLELPDPHFFEPRFSGVGHHERQYASQFLVLDLHAGRLNSLSPLEASRAQQNLASSTSALRDFIGILATADASSSSTAEKMKGACEFAVIGIIWELMPIYDVNAPVGSSSL